MKIYIAGKITGFKDFKNRFKQAENYLKGKGHKVMNPAILPSGFTQHEYMKICYTMIDVCDAIYLLNNWEDSTGAKREHDYAISNGKKLIFE